MAPKMHGDHQINDYERMCNLSNLMVGRRSVDDHSSDPSLGNGVVIPAVVLGVAAYSMNIIHRNKLHTTLSQFKWPNLSSDA